MASSSPESDPATYFGFTDIVGFRDFIGYVALCAPEMFSEEDWLKPDEQMNLDRAFIGLRYGLELLAKEDRDSVLLAKCGTLIEESYVAFQSRRDLQGQERLEDVSRLLKKLR